MYLPQNPWFVTYARLHDVRLHQGRPSSATYLGLAAGGEFHSTLIIDGEFEEMAESVVDAEDQFGPSELVRMSARNLPHVEVLPQIGANVYSILRRRTLIVTKSGLEQLIARLDAPIKR